MSMIRPLAISFVCALLLTTMHASSIDQIKQNRIDYEERVLRDLFGTSVSSEITDPDLTLTRTDQGYAVTHAGIPVGSIRRALTDEGYNGRIGLWVAVDDKGVIQGAYL